MRFVASTRLGHLCCWCAQRPLLDFSNSQFIATVPKRGYRFVASLKVWEEQTATPALERAIVGDAKEKMVNGAVSSDWPVYLQERGREQEPETLPAVAPQPETSAVTMDRASRGHQMTDAVRIIEGK